MAERISFVAVEPTADRAGNLEKLKALEGRMRAEGVKAVSDAKGRLRWDFPNGDRYIYTRAEGIREFKVEKIGG